MEKQVLIALGREFGSGGREIARRLAERLGLPLYDQNMLEQIAETYQMELDTLKRYDEAPRKLVFSRRVNGYSNSPEDNVAQMEFTYIKDLAEQGKSFVVLGRCAEEILKDYPGLISIFVRADEAFKTRRILERGAESEQEALVLMLKTDRKRRQYHDQFCAQKWGESGTYDLVIDCSKLDIDGTVDFLEHYVRMRGV